MAPMHGSRQRSGHYLARRVRFSAEPGTAVKTPQASSTAAKIFESAGAGIRMRAETCLVFMAAHQVPAATITMTYFLGHGERDGSCDRSTSRNRVPSSMADECTTFDGGYHRRG